MKNRQGFVSNSSSASFVIKKDKLCRCQINKILNYQEEAFELGAYTKDDECGKFGWIDNFWYVDETEDEVTGNTIMDNFDMRSFLEAIGVDEKDIEWDGDN